MLNAMMPRLQLSATTVYLSLSFMATSGAIYASVPQKVCKWYQVKHRDV